MHRAYNNLRIYVGTPCLKCMYRLQVCELIGLPSPLQIKYPGIWEPWHAPMYVFPILRHDRLSAGLVESPPPPLPGPTLTTVCTFRHSQLFVDDVRANILATI